MPDPEHTPVLPEETLDLLAPRPGEIAVDCTLGRGGHALLLAGAVGASRDDAGAPGLGRLVGFELDPANLAASRAYVEKAGLALTAFRESFVRAAARMRNLGLRADVVLADLGFSSSQMDDPSRGLSFGAEGPLDMRLDPSSPRTAADLVASLPEAELADVIYEYGEEPLARKIARKLALARERQPIDTTAQLAALVNEAYGRRARASRMHPATRTFMALRIAVNGELEALDALLDSVVAGAREAHGARGAPGVPRAPGAGWLNAGARVAVISFHSLEDRRVKRAFAGIEEEGLGTRLTRRPVTAGPREVEANPRSRSAKLRVVRMTPFHGE